jgi:hypothetical protein
MNGTTSTGTTGFTNTTNIMRTIGKDVKHRHERANNTDVVDGYEDATSFRFPADSMAYRARGSSPERLP